jgi:hypothetical protein
MVLPAINCMISGQALTEITLLHMIDDNHMTIKVRLLYDIYKRIKVKKNLILTCGSFTFIETVYSNIQKVHSGILTNLNCQNGN